jgi:hypothetical protein
MSAFDDWQQPPSTKRCKVQQQPSAVVCEWIVRLVSEFLPMRDLPRFACTCVDVKRALRSTPVDLELTYEDIVRYFDPATSAWVLVGASLVGNWMDQLPRGIMLRRLRIGIEFRLAFELSWSWSHLDLTQLETLVCREQLWLTDITEIGSCTNLHTLDLQNCDWLTDITALGNGTFRSLHTVNLNECLRLTSISALGNCSKLHNLNVGNCTSLNDISGLARCSNLSDVDLSHCPYLTDITALGKCTSLRTLDLSSCDQLTDISALGHCSLLYRLYLTSCPYLTDITALGKCSSLRVLDLSQCRSLRNLEVLWDGKRRMVNL